MRIAAPAKLNLMLHVTGRRADGYHTLQSAIAFTDIADTLVLEPADAFSLTVTGPFAHHAPSDDTNLVVRAAVLMGNPNLAVTLTKNVPAGAGLGGGSADAAALMLALRGERSLDDLKALGLKIGAELPACLAGQPQWVEGIGERLFDLSLLQSLEAVVIWPGQPLSTEAVFKAYGGNFSKPIAMPDAITPAWLLSCRNDLTDAACNACPEIKHAVAALAIRTDCYLVRMSGSGSSVFGLFHTREAAKETAAFLAAAHPEWWVQSCKIIP